MIKIKAKKNCKYCGGKGIAVPFIGPYREDICPCIKDQIEIVENK